MSEYKATVVEYPAKRLVGMKVLTSMKKASADCPACWQAFCRHFDKCVPDGCKGSYGLSFMINAEDFYYWAAVDADLAKDVPEGLERVDIPAGLYAACVSPNLEKVGEAYSFLYQTWLSGQSEYALNEQAPCFELYPPNWQLTDSFEVFMPIRKI